MTDNGTASPIEKPWGKLIPCLSFLEPVDIYKPTLKIGRGQGCDMILSNSLLDNNGHKGSTISKEHCLLKKGPDDTFLITDLSKNGTYLNGRNIGKGQTVVLKDSDKIGCTTETFYVFKVATMETQLPDTLTPASTGETPQSLTPRAIIPTWGRLISCRLHLKSFDLTNLTFKVGRSPYCDAAIDQMELDPRIKKYFSKEHFILIRDSETSITYITDLSSCGTYLNGQRIGKDHKNILQHDDTISIGPKRKKVYVFKSMHANDTQYLPVELRKKYEPCRVLGKGACGEVRLAYHKRTCQMYAIKNILKARSTASQMNKLNHPSKIRTEITILKSLSHPFVIRMEDIIETDEEVFIVLEYMRGGELTDRIRSTVPLTECNVKFLFYQIVLAVRYLHSNGIAHRDLKPENVLMATEAVETLIKVSDFGLGKIMDGDDTMKTMCGTWCYVAPEVLDARHQEYDKQVDVWSLGVMLFYMLSRQLPFKSPDTAVLTELIKNGIYKMEEADWNGVSFQAKDLVRKMLTVDPRKRITVDGILKHPWLEKDVAMQYRVQSMLADIPSRSQDVMPTCDMEPPAKRVRLSSEESVE